MVSRAAGRARQQAGTAPLSNTSSFAPGPTRSWTSIADFMQAVASDCVYEGVHFRSSTEVGSALGREVGKTVATKVQR